MLNCVGVMCTAGKCRSYNCEMCRASLANGKTAAMSGLRFGAISVHIHRIYVYMHEVNGYRAN
jgi:hypothetical protein